MYTFSIFIISVVSSIGLSILLVEKGEDWPVIIFSSKLKYILSKIYVKLPEMLECTVCASFWTSLFVELFLYFVTNGHYFLWPISGFSTLGIMWIIIEILNYLDK